MWGLLLPSLLTMKWLNLTAIMQYASTPLITKTAAN